jgi:hypothetical protein
VVLDSSLLAKVRLHLLRRHWDEVVRAVNSGQTQGTSMDEFLGVGSYIAEATNEKLKRDGAPMT